MSVIDLFLRSEGLLLTFGLGLRHGLDPDHLSAIDGIAFRAQKIGKRTPWAGTWFALGHGAVVTAMAVLVSVLSHRLAFDPAVLTAAQWASIGLLILMGWLNLQALLSPGPYRPLSWRGRRLPLPGWLGINPFSVGLLGASFALAFDTATQATAWGYAALAHGGPLAAGGIGVAFTLGMISTDSLDGRLLWHVLGQPGDAQRYRRGVGWFVVVLSFAMAAYGSLAMLAPGAQLGDLETALLGVVLLAGPAIAWGYYSSSSTW